MKIREVLWIIVLSSLTVICLDLLTNSINTTNNSWDFLYYIELAKDGFNADPLASPFAYRYLVPLLIHGMSVLGLTTIGQGFRYVAYFGAIAQLAGIFFFLIWLNHSRKGAYLAMAVTAFSLYNIKFLLFDVYRPDHLAYAIILLQTFLAFNRRFVLLLGVTLIASQIREYNIIPLIAYLFMIMHDKDRRLAKYKILISMIFLLPALVLPRILIPVTENYQIIGLSRDGLVNLLLLPFIPTISANFIFSILAYLIPLLFVADLRSILTMYLNLPKYQEHYLAGYTFLVILLSYYGGTDFFRFATFLFLPQIIMISKFAVKIRPIQIVFMFIFTFVFNRIWMHFPDWDVEKYRDFYGGFSTRLNQYTLYRIMECAFILAVGYALRKSEFILHGFRKTGSE